jgi:hypothetical protein
MVDDGWISSEYSDKSEFGDCPPWCMEVLAWDDDGGFVFASVACVSVRAADNDV